VSREGGFARQLRHLPGARAGPRLVVARPRGTVTRPVSLDGGRSAASPQVPASTLLARRSSSARRSGGSECPGDG
jgi:hypothetical protein